MRTRRIADALRVRKNGFRVLPLIIFIDRVILLFNPCAQSQLKAASLLAPALPWPFKSPSQKRKRKHLRS